MKNLKRNFAKTALNFEVRDSFEKGIASVIIGAACMLPGLYLAETVDMDDTSRPGNEIAIQEYATALNVLDEYETNTGIYTTPSDLHTILELSGSDVGSLSEKEQAQQAFKELSHMFGASVIVDRRLNEQQKHDLIDEFEERIGEFETHTGLYEPDYSDLDEVQERVLEQSNNRETASLIIEKSFKVGNPGIIGKTSGAGFLFTLLSLMLISRNRNRLQSWANREEYKKPSKFKH